MSACVLFIKLFLLFPYDVIEKNSSGLLIMETGTPLKFVYLSVQGCRDQSNMQFVFVSLNVLEIS